MSRALGAAFVALVVVALPGLADAQSCPSANVSDVLADPRVQDALDQAWRDSMEGTEDEHEEGGWISSAATRTPSRTR